MSHNQAVHLYAKFVRYCRLLERSYPLMARKMRLNIRESFEANALLGKEDSLCCLNEGRQHLETLRCLTDLQKEDFDAFFQRERPSLNPTPLAVHSKTKQANK